MATTFFPILDMARLEMKPRLYTTYWKTFSSIQPLMLFLSSPREDIFALPPCLPWNLTSSRVEFPLFTSCSHSDPHLSRQGAALAQLDSLPPHNLVSWTDGCGPFSFGKGGSGVLANCSLCGAKATLSFSPDPVYSSFSAEAYANLHALH